MTIIKNLGYCDNTECDEIAQPLVQCESAKCEDQKKGTHYHCKNKACGSLLGFASQVSDAVKIPKV